jgi:polar amino acid transport system substrate-binding protein
MSFRWINRVCFVIVLFFLSSVSTLSKERIILAADKWCPYNCEPGSEMPGYMVEMATEIFAQHNIEVEYILKPWDKAIEDIRQGKIHGVIGASFDENSDLVYPTVPQAYGITAAYTLEENKWTYEGTKSLRGQKIGLILGYKYPEDIGNFIFTTLPKAPELFVFEGGENAVHEQVNNLINKRTDIYFENEYVMNRLIKSENGPKLRNAGQIGNDLDRLYVAFSPKLKKSYTYAKILSEGMEKMRNSGRLAELYKKYGLNSN